jgi:hypothetical protein
VVEVRQRNIEGLRAAGNGVRSGFTGAVSGRRWRNGG